MIHFPPRKDRLKSTRTRVLRGPELVPIALIRPTNEVFPPDCRKISYSPICLVKDFDGFLYIVDGNHRFYKRVIFEKQSSEIPAWILRDGDQDRIEGNPIPGILKDWKTGHTTLEEVARRARFQWVEWEGVNPSLSPTLTIGPEAIDPAGRTHTEKYPEWPRTRKFQLVLQLIMDELSIEEASQQYSLPVSTIEQWLHISLQAMRDAL